MESGLEAKKLSPAEPTTRETALWVWLEQDCGLKKVTLHAMPGDASSRRYYRVNANQTSFVAMDAKAPQENCPAFIAIANALRKMGLTTPTILHAHEEQGFLLLTDFGDTTYLRALQKQKQNPDPLYQQALTVLATLQQCKEVPGREIPLFTEDVMWQEWAWHKEWVTTKWLSLPITNAEALDRAYAFIVESAVAQPQVFMHRDYHSANLMLLPNQTVGILDFQDAFIGPITYDLVSLLRDCYIDWPASQVQQWVLFYQQKLLSQGIRLQQNELLRWFDLMGIQRHLKAMLTFARKKVRDQQPEYLQHIPRTMNYLLTTVPRYPELAALNHYLVDHVQPLLNEKTLCAR